MMNICNADKVLDYLLYICRNKGRLHEQDIVFVFNQIPKINLKTEADLLGDCVSWTSNNEHFVFRGQLKEVNYLLKELSKEGN